MDNVNKLSTLCIPSLLLDSGTGLLLIASLIVNNRTTLRHLDIGVESSVFDYQNLGSDYDDTNVLKKFWEDIVVRFKRNKSVFLPNIDNIRLRGLDLSAMMRGEQHRVLNFASLKHLALESCSAINNSLQRLTALSLRGLQTFHIRQEKYRDNFLELLENFLCTLQPLTALSILINGLFPDALEIEQILQVHAGSLRSCIMDLRDVDRIATIDSRTAWRQQYSVDIIEQCPNLVELGIAVNWEILNLGTLDGRLVRELVIYSLMSVLLLTLFTVSGDN